MELREAKEMLEDLKKFIYPEPEKEASRIIEAIDTILSFCQSVLECKGAPQKRECLCDNSGNYCDCGAVDFNKCHAEFSAYHTKIMDGIQSLLNSFYNCDNPNCGNGAICNYCALKKDMTAIVAELKEGKP